MSPRLILIGLAVVLALGASIYLGMQAGAPTVKREPLVTAKTEPNKKSLPSPFKTTPAPLPPRTVPTPSPTQGSDAPAAPALDQAQILAALKVLDSTPDTPEKQAKRQELVAILAGQDPAVALTYVDTLTGEEHVLEEANVYGVWAAADPHAAATHLSGRYVNSLTADGLPSSAAAIAQAWAEKDTTAAWAWVGTLPEGTRGPAMAEVVSKIAEKDPQAALHAVNTLKSDAERAEAMQPLASQWAQKAPIVAAAWVSSLKAESEQSYAASGLITGWMTSSPRNASEWVSKLPQGNTRDAAVVAMVQAPTAMKNPEAALTWTASIQNVELRNQMLPQIMKLWQAKDPDGAAQFIAKHSKR